MNEEVREGFSKVVFRLMHMKAESMLKREKLCTVTLNEISIKYHADYNRRLDEVSSLETPKFNKKAILANHIIIFMAYGICSRKC